MSGAAGLRDHYTIASLLTGMDIALEPELGTHGRLSRTMRQSLAASFPHTRVDWNLLPSLSLLGSADLEERTRPRL